MGIVKKALKKVAKGITGRDPAEEAANAERDAALQAEEQAVLAANKANVDASAAAGAADSTTADATQTASAAKKKLKGGRKGLTIARSGGTGINI